MAFEICWAWRSKVTVAKATVPSLLIPAAPPDANGDATVDTWGTFSTLVNIVVMRPFSAGSVTFAPPVAPTTIRSESPDTFGETDCRRWIASVDSVLGSEKLFE